MWAVGFSGGDGGDRFSDREWPPDLSSTILINREEKKDLLEGGTNTEKKNIKQRNKQQGRRRPVALLYTITVYSKEMKSVDHIITQQY